MYADFAYELATNIEKSAYPTYCDGLKTKEMFMERLSKAFERDTEEVLLFEIDGKIEGLIHYQWLPKDNYVATCGFNINTATGQALSEFIAYVRAKCKGYDLYLGFPADNKVAIQYFEKQAFECIEDQRPRQNPSGSREFGGFLEADSVIPSGIRCKTACLHHILCAGCSGSGLDLE